MVSSNHCRSSATISSKPPRSGSAEVLHGGLQDGLAASATDRRWRRDLAGHVEPQHGTERGDELALSPPLEVSLEECQPLGAVGVAPDATAPFEQFAQGVQRSRRMHSRAGEAHHLVDVEPEQSHERVSDGGLADPRITGEEDAERSVLPGRFELLEHAAPPDQRRPAHS